MEFLMDPSIWAGLLTLVVLEIVLGIDNLVFIAILAEKLPPAQRDRAVGKFLCDIVALHCLRHMKLQNARRLIRGREAQH